jgi:predicted RNase H-like nuclease (RuvC/YqgF family)
MEKWETAATAFLGFLSGGGGAWVLGLLKQRGEDKRAVDKQKSDIQLSETDKAFVIYKEIVDSLKHDMSELSHGMHTMEQQHIECREQNAKLNAKIDIQADKIANYEARISQLEKELAAYKQTK